MFIFTICTVGSLCINYENEILEIKAVIIINYDNLRRIHELAIELEYYEYQILKGKIDKKQVQRRLDKLQQELDVLLKLDGEDYGIWRC